MPLNRIIADSITDGTIVAADIGDNTITLAKLQSGLLPPAISNSAATYANAAFTTANTSAAAGSYANSAFATANTSAASGSYANSAFTTANTSAASGSYANSAFATANTSAASGSYANSAFTKANNSLGSGQTWSNLTASRASGTTYTNSTGKPIMVTVCTDMGTNQRIEANVGGVKIVDMGGSTIYGDMGLNVFIVPNSTTYVVTATYGTIQIWAELR
jgi:hypothetical protein